MKAIPLPLETPSPRQQLQERFKAFVAEQTEKELKKSVCEGLEHAAPKEFRYISKVEDIIKRFH